MISSSRSKRGLEKNLKFSIGTSSSENDSSSLEVQSSSISKRVVKMHQYLLYEMRVKERLWVVKTGMIAIYGGSPEIIISLKGLELSSSSSSS
ncbi:hypothetical protein Tco_1449799 [Tanacetum coccineum]